MRRSSALWKLAGVAGAGTLFAPSWIRAQAPDTVQVADIRAVTDAPLFIAHEKGFFREVGIAAQFQDFTSGATMISSLGAGQLDVGGGAASAGLFNAFGRGIAIEIVADRGRSKPGYGFVPLVVRTELVTSGAFKSPADLKGLRVAEPAKGTANLCQIVKVLETAGLTYDDVRHVYLGFSDQLTALRNGSIDASTMVEPYATLAKNLGVGVVVMGDDKFYPNQEVSLIFYSQQFAQRRNDVAKRFMVAYLRGQRFFLGALKGPHLAGPNAGEVIEILSKRLKIDPTVLREMTSAYPDPDGRVDQKTLNEDLSIYRSQGLIVGNATVEQIVDMSFASAAAKELGPFRG